MIDLSVWKVTNSSSFPKSRSESYTCDAESPTKVKLLMWRCGCLVRLESSDPHIFGNSLLGRVHHPKLCAWRRDCDLLHIWKKTFRICGDLCSYGSKLELRPRELESSPVPSNKERPTSVGARLWPNPTFSPPTHQKSPCHRRGAGWPDSACATRETTAAEPRICRLKMEHLLFVDHPYRVSSCFFHIYLSLT